MAIASPITRQSVGKTFIVAISLLSATALAQLVAITWAFVQRVGAQQAAVSRVPALESTWAPSLARLTTPQAPDFTADPLAPEGTVQAGPVTPPPKPTPIQAPLLRLTEPVVPETRYAELIEQGKTLRERGDMSTALIKLREAQRMDQRSAQALFEIATTYDKMALPDRAAEQWRRIYDMGESAAGVYYTVAEAKLKASQAQAILQSVPQTPTPPADVEGIATGATLGMLAISSEDKTDAASTKRFTLRIPLKARPNTKVDVRDLVIQVMFYDIVDGQNVVTTAANTSNRWSTSPPDWSDSDTEVLEVDYQLPAGDPRAARREDRKYFGYIVRVYYKDELQASAASPERLAQQYPAPRTLPKE